MAALVSWKTPKCCGSICKKNSTHSEQKGDDIDDVYAWIIAVASFFGHLLIYGIIYCSGVFYEMFREMFEGSSSMLSLIAILSTAFTYGFSPIPGVLINKYGQRIVTITGGVVAGTGLLLSSYATNVYYIAVTFGVITGMGFGTCYLAILSIVSLYFKKYRIVAFGLSTSGAGLGTFVYPPIIRFLVNIYGVRGTMLIISGITLNLCVCGSLMRAPRITSQGSELRTRPTQNKKSECLSLWNLHIFKNVGFITVCFNNLFALFGLNIVLVHLTAYSVTININKDMAAMLISVFGISLCIGQLSFGVIGKVRCGPVIIYSASYILSGLVVILMTVVQDFISLAILSAALGFLSASISPLLPEIITLFLSVELLPSAFGYLLVFEAVGSLLGPPTAGWLFDVLHRYRPCFYLAGAALGLSGIIILIPYFIRRSGVTSTDVEVIDAHETDKKDESLCLDNKYS
ncbi:hypothetical protein LSH36_183g01073 [Paralvinella palmiformis]|uniref:Major facilitator superfamily (MFS) profile domain-containing protein n=1 Tax=Paralvinella palmiformis TaxID=53620 RepID=A0AAD9JR75_9ANNE|nr:hypothetical protein LSH36_183g01073 [Paralvinella palmiformis]